MSAPHATGGGATRCVTPRQTCPGLMASGATCVQRLDGSRDSAIHTKYRISLTFFIDARAEISVAESRFDIRETVPSARAPARTGPPVRRTLRFGFPWACRAGGSLARTSSAFARAGGEGTGRGRSPRARAPILFATCSRSASAGFGQ
ncbi:UNVERIFIED_CONTAM: hypothetical protein Sindi_3144200 [Sesamum indicum]